MKTLRRTTSGISTLSEVLAGCMRIHERRASPTHACRGQWRGTVIIFFLGCHCFASFSGGTQHRRLLFFSEQRRAATLLICFRNNTAAVLSCSSSVSPCGFSIAISRKANDMSHHVGNMNKSCCCRRLISHQ